VYLYFIVCEWERESYSRAKEAASERRMEKRERADSSEREA